MRLRSYALTGAVILTLTGAAPAAASRPSTDVAVQNGFAAAAMFADRQAELGRDWPADACAGQPVTVTMVDLPAGMIGAAAGGCAIQVDPFAAMSPWMVCDTVEHERLHLWRGDDWHADDPRHPLHERFTRVSSRCLELMPLPRSTVTIREGRAALRDRLGEGWRLRAVNVTAAAGRGHEDVTFRARARGRRVREYVAFRDFGELRVQRSCYQARPVGCQGY